MKLKNILTFILLLVYSAVQAQSTSGTDFWMAFIQNEDTDTLSSKNFYYIRLFLSAQEASEVTVSNDKLGYKKTISVAANSVEILTLPFHDFNMTEYGKVDNKSVHVSSDNPISVYAENYQAASCDATLVLPTTACGSYYIVQNNVSRSVSEYYFFLPSVFNVVAFEDNTEIEITPTLETSDGKPANETFKITLNKGDVYQVCNKEKDMGKGLSGSQIFALNGKKIAVYTGNRCSNVPDTQLDGDSDILFDVSYPVSSWGKKFIIRPLLDGNNDIIKCTACKDGTKIYKDGKLLATINALESYEFSVAEADGAFKVETTEPVSVYQYMTSCNYVTKRDIGGPSYQYVAPIEQAINKISFSTVPNLAISTHYLNVVLKTEDVSTSTLNGETNYATFTPVDDVYSTAAVPLKHGQHTLEAEHGFIANVYGQGRYISYSYSAGSKIDPINLEGEYVVTFDGNGATGGTMYNRTYKIGVDETTALDTNKFERQYKVTLNTTGGDSIEAQTCKYAFNGWAHEEPLTQVTKNLENWNSINVKSNGLQIDGLVNLTNKEGTNYINTKPQSGVRELLYSKPIYMPAGDFDLSLQFCSPTGYSNISTSWEYAFKFAACDQPQNKYGNDYGMLTKGNNKSAVALEGLNASETFANRKFTIFANGETPVYLSINCGNLYDGVTYEFRLKDFILSKDNSTTLYYTDYEPTKNIVREEGGIVALKALWEPTSTTLPLPERDGYEFVEWNTNIKGTGTSFIAGDPFTPVKDTTLYAIWKAKKPCEPVQTTVDALLCADDTFRIGEKEFTKPGVYTINLKNKQGCDSIVTLNLKAARTDTIIINDFIINETHYERYGFNVDVKLGTFNFFMKTFKNEYGCDSMVTLVLNSLTQPIPVYDTICKGETYTVNGETFSETGEYKVVLGKYQGCDCDSSMQLHLFVAEPNETTYHDTVSIKEGQYTGHGFSIDRPRVGTSTYTETYKNQFGCDSVINLVLNVTPYTVYGEDIYEEVCDNETFTYKDSTYKPGKTYTLYDTTATGYDSIINLHIKGLPTSSSTYTEVIKKGEDYTKNGFDLPTQEETGVFYYKQTTTNMYGCDSTVTMQLIVEAPMDSIIIPTLFTPQTRDGKNDVFMKGYEVYIYDRYGNLVCHSKDGWDGYYRGKKADPGVYIYTLFLKDGRKKKGSIEIYK